MSSLPRSEESTAERGSLVGKVLSERYRIERHIRSSNMSHVYEGHDLTLQQRVAVKVLHEDIVNERTLCRFFLEARIGRLLGSNSHTVPVTDVGFTANALPYFVMEYLVGEDLAAHLRKKQRISAEQAIAILLELCAAVAAVHGAGIVHRDLKPSNVFLKSDGHACLIDFGVCKLADSDFSLTHTGELVGSLNYVPPERWVDPDDARLCGDVWSLAIILYELLTGRVPFKGQTKSSLQNAILTQDIQLGLGQGVVPELDTVLLVALHKDPRYRYSTVEEFAGALARAAFDAGLRDEPGWLEQSGTQPSSESRPSDDTHAQRTESDDNPPKHTARAAAPKAWFSRSRMLLVGVGLLGAGIALTLSMLGEGEAPVANGAAVASAPVAISAPKESATGARTAFGEPQPPPVAMRRSNTDAKGGKVSPAPRAAPAAPPAHAGQLEGNPWRDEIGLSRPRDPEFPSSQPQPAAPVAAPPSVDLTPDDLRRF